MRRFAFVLAPLAILGLTSALVGGCKQKEGERCQVDEDCESGLVCSKGTVGVCLPPGSSIDGGVKAPDARVDGGPPDAAVDAKPPDAAVDAKI